MCTVILNLFIADRIIKLYKIELKFLTLLNFTLVYFFIELQNNVWMSGLII